MTNHVFLRNFDAEIEAEARAEAHARACRFTQEDIDAAVAIAERRAYEAGHEAGEAAGRAAAADTLAARQAEALEAIAPQLSALMADRLSHHAALERQLLGFALAVCEKVFPAFLATRSAEAAAARIRSAIGYALHSPHLKIRLSTATQALLAPELAALKQGPAGPEHLDIAIDPALADGDARVSWHDGYMESSYGTVCASILATLRASHEAKAGPAAGRNPAVPPPGDGAASHIRKVS